MTSVPKAVATVLVGVACLTGLTACGGDDGVKISDAAFVAKCKKELDKNAKVKAYASDICTCVQDELVKGGNGDKTDQDEGLKDETVTATTKCTREAAGIQ
jgi:hypothetical protein